MWYDWPEAGLSGCSRSGASGGAARRNPEPAIVPILSYCPDISSGLGAAGDDVSGADV